MMSEEMVKEIERLRKALEEIRSFANTHPVYSYIYKLSSRALEK
jgi:hypothetical protein